MTHDVTASGEVAAADLQDSARDRWILATLLLATFLLRALQRDQPIVENYVGRQVPTAMVARNLDRGSGFLRPQLDTGPFPNLFLVEPPVYATAVVALKRVTGLALEPSGRLVSAFATAMAAWGLYGLVRRRDGKDVAWIAVAIFAVLPVTIRYGRAFQPDALMLGTLLAGLRCWDESESKRAPGWLVAAWGFLATALALKVISAPLLVLLIVVILRPRRPWKIALALATVLPALLWYAYASTLLSSGSRASADNAAIWGRTLLSTALLRPGTYRTAATILFIRAFTPLGFALAAWGFWKGKADRFWVVWTGAAAVTLAILAGKAHHEYYWLILAPPLTVFGAQGLKEVFRWQPSVATALGLLFLGLAVWQSRATWQTPREWEGLERVANEVRRLVPADALVIAPEALLFAADRRGCRLETGRATAVRAAGEWGGTLGPDEPLALVEFYRSRGADFFTDLATTDDPRRRALHEAVRRRYAVRVDRDGVLLARLSQSEDDRHDGH